MDVVERRTLADAMKYLPLEILQNIFNILPPPILLILQESCYENISYMSRQIRTASFEDCPSMSALNVKAYLDARTSCITILNLNYCKYQDSRKASLICSAIVKLPRLKSLSLWNCNLHDGHISEIFQRLTSVEYFAWDVNVREFSKIFHMTTAQQSLKKLSLLISGKWDLAFASEFFFKRCPLIEEIDIKMKEIRQPMIPQLFKTNLNFMHLHSLTATFLNTENCTNAIDNFCSVVNILIKAKSPTKHWKKFWIGSSDVIKLPDKIVLESAGLISSAFAIPSDITLQHQQLSNTSSIEAIGLRLDGSLYGDHIQWITETSNTRLKLLSLDLSSNNRHYQYQTPIPELPATSSSEMNNLFKIRNNITVLNLHACHFSESICNALCQLKALKSLHLASCALKGTMTNVHANSTNESVSDKVFSDVVDCCTSVTDFDLNGCGVLKSCAIIDEDLKSLPLWIHLKRLALSNLPSLKKCSFLVPTAFHLKRLELVNVSKHFPIEAVGNTLVHAKSLTSIRLHHAYLPVQRFFATRGIKYATSLENICFYQFNLNIEYAKYAAELFQPLINLRSIHLINHPIHEHNFHRNAAMEAFKNSLEDVFKDRARPLEINIKNTLLPCEFCLDEKKCLSDIWL